MDVFSSSNQMEAACLNPDLGKSLELQKAAINSS